MSDPVIRRQNPADTRKLVHYEIEDAINENCPWSGKPVSADSLTLYKGEVVGFCNPGCRDKFQTAVAMFEGKLGG